MKLVWCLGFVGFALGQVDETFARYDKDKDGLVSEEEMIQGVAADMGVKTPNREAVVAIQRMIK